MTFVAFVYDTNHYDVLEVSRSGYDDKNLLMNVTEGEEAVFLN